MVHTLHINYRQIGYKQRGQLIRHKNALICMKTQNFIKMWIFNGHHVTGVIIKYGKNSLFYKFKILLKSLFFINIAKEHITWNSLLWRSYHSAFIFSLIDPSILLSSLSWHPQFLVYVGNKVNTTSLKSLQDKSTISVTVIATLTEWCCNQEHQNLYRFYICWYRPISITRHHLLLFTTSGTRTQRS